MAQLYPLKFEPIYKEKIWGGNRISNFKSLKTTNHQKIGESWEISAIEDNLSIVSNGFLAGNDLQELIEIYMGDLLGEKVYEQFGLEFPLLIKLIDAADDLSIQVHPDDQLAAHRHNAFGKTEMWYVIAHEENATLISGFNKPANTHEYLYHLENNTLPQILNHCPVSVGDVFFVPPGRIHAIGKGILLAEIQQTSDVTYRIYDYNRLENNAPRALHTDLALKAIDYQHTPAPKTQTQTTTNKTSTLIDCKYFTTSILHCDIPIEKDYTHIDSFVIYIAISGEVQIATGEDVTELQQGETILIPAEIKNTLIQPKGKASLLEVYIR